MDSFFANLEKKALRHEEYFTQLVSYAFNSNPNLVKEFTKNIFPDRYVEEAFDTLIIKPEYFEQGTGRFDIKISNEEKLVIIIENKMGAKETTSRKKQKESHAPEDIEKEKKQLDKDIEKEKKQLDNYIDWLAHQSCKLKMLLLITHPYSEYKDIEKRLRERLKTDEKVNTKDIMFKHLSWLSFHEFLKGYFAQLNKDISGNDKQKFLVEELLNYMEGKNMDTWKPITKEDGMMLKSLMNWGKILNDLTIIFKDEFNLSLAHGNSGQPLVDWENLSIYRKVEIKDKEKLSYGFDNGDNKDFCFLIQLYPTSKKMQIAIKNHVESRFECEHFKDENKWGIDVFLPLDEAFLGDDFIKQKNKLETFCRDVLKSLVELKTIEGVKS